MKRIFGLLLLFTSVTFAQTWESGTIVKWELKDYSQSAHITRNQIVYSVRVGKVIYQVARRRDKVEMAAGQQVKCRTEKGHFFVRDDRGKETKYEIVGTEQLPLTN